MTLDRPTLVDGLLDEYDTYRRLLADLTAEEARRMTRCDGWTVHDVLAHVVGLASDAFAGRIGRFTPDEQAAMRQDLTLVELADELEQCLLLADPLLRAATDEQWHGPSGAEGVSLGRGVHLLWFDAWVHRDDVRSALGQAIDTARDSSGLAASRAYVAAALADRGWAAPAHVDVAAIDDHRFVLAATGRIAAADVGLDPSVNLYRRTAHSNPPPAGGR